MDYTSDIFESGCSESDIKCMEEDSRSIIDEENTYNESEDPEFVVFSFSKEIKALEEKEASPN